MLNAQRKDTLQMIGTDQVKMSVTYVSMKSTL
jgi:hypothetical protein